MTSKDLFTYEQIFEIAYRSKRGEEFQTFFSDIMNHVYPFRFVPTCTWGRIGDKKCDGYCLDNKTVFQVYAPHELEKTKTEEKMREDFHGALKQWGAQMKEWVFVDNAIEGVPVFILEEINEFEKQYPNIKIRHMGYLELKELLFNEPDSTIIQILGPLPSDGEIEEKPKIETSEYWEVIRDLCELMLLDRYEWWNEHAMRGLVFDDLVCNKLPLYDLKMTYNWLGKDCEMEKRIKDLIDRFVVFIEVFMEHAFYRQDSFWGEQKFYKAFFPNPNYHSDLNLFKEWELKWFKALNNYVVVLNTFISYINTNYTVDIPELKRKKMLIDSFGIYGAVPLLEQHFYPDKIFDVDLVM